MKKAWIGCFLVMIVACGLVWAEDPEEKESQNLVNQAVHAFQQHDKQYVLKLLNASSGPFRKTKELYVMVLDFDGVMLAHPVFQKMVGKSQWDFVDANGKFIAREQVRIAKEQGEGWMDVLVAKTRRDASHQKTNICKKSAW